MGMYKKVAGSGGMIVLLLVAVVGMGMGFIAPSLGLNSRAEFGFVVGSFLFGGAIVGVYMLTQKPGSG
ncbi:hypothetical protein LCGC14_2064660 [marine sediment metagenome]|uniref:Uncharacterized protein n=1 Tax=marine sediment metagenome TaxID=412755 RepID=A0A0F9GYM8_9ZZZZ